MPDDRIEVTLDDEPEEPAGDRLVISLDDLAAEDDRQALPGFHAGFSPTTPQPMSKGKEQLSRMLGSVLWQMAVAGTVGGFLGWALTEPFITDEGSHDFVSMFLEAGLIFSIIGAMIGVCLGVVEGLVTRVYQKCIRGGLFGLLFGFAGGVVGGIIGQLIFYIMLSIASANPMNAPGLIVQIASRAVSWAMVGLFIGSGEGISIRSTRKILNGLAGGFIGGAVGGGLFDLIGSAFNTGDVSRCVGFTLLGTCTGLAIGMVEELTKQAWLRVTGGPFFGKEFILYHETTVVGSSPKCEITIIKDPGVMPQHCALRAVGGGYEIASLQDQAPTAVNGHPVRQARLHDGDRIQLGRTELTYSERAARRVG